MKNKRLLIAALALLPLSRVLAQTNEYDSYMKTVGDYATLYRGRIEPTLIKTQWKDHPYLFDKGFIEGTISIKGIVYNNVKIRYDIYRNYLIIVTKEKKIPVLPDKSMVDFFVLYGKLYVPYDGMFVCVEHNGMHLSLLHKTRKKKGLDVIEDSYSYHTLETKDTYYLYRENGNVTEFKGVNQLYKAFPQYKKALKNYIKENDIKLSKDFKTTGFAQSVAFVDSMLAVDNGEHERVSPYAFKETKSNDVKVAQAERKVVPSSVFEELAIDNTTPSYDAYKVDGTVKYNQAEEDDYAYNPVYSDMEPYAEARSLDEVQVVGFRQKLGMEQSGMEAFRPALLKNMPLVMGESDVIKMTLMLPGVQSTGEAASGLNVRGGSTDQNLILLNNGTVFNSMHLFGLFSAFNTDLISETQLYKGGIPAQYGGRISSVLDIKGKYGDMKEFHGYVSAGTVTSKATIEAPIVKDKVSFLLSGRTTYSDWMLKKIPEKSGYKNGTAGFGDLGGVITAKVSDKHRINAYGYFSRDRFSFTQDDNYKYKNINGSLEWKGTYSDSLLSNVAIGYDHYDYMNDTELNSTQSGRLEFNINQFFFKGNVKYIMNDEHAFTLGVNSTLYNIMPGQYGPADSLSSVSNVKLINEKALESALFIEDVWSLTDKLKVTGGLRVNVFNSMKDNMKKTYFSPELRLSGSYSLTDESSIKAGFNNLNQYVHKVSNTVIMCPTDTWILSNSSIKPQNGIQFSLGYYRNWNNYEFAVEGYYKRLGNLLTYRNGALLVMNEHIEEDIVAGKGRAFGIELQVHKQYGKLTGWANYTFSRTQMRQNDANIGSVINGGEWFNADYDSPHAFKMFANYKFTHRLSMSLNVDYRTGRPMTVPVGQYLSYSEGRYLPYYDKRNSVRMPDYLRTDWSFNVEPTHHITSALHTWLSFGVYNLLGRKNAYSIYYTSENGKLNCYRLSIFGAPIPYAAINIKF